MENRSRSMDAYAVCDAMIFGKGVFGVFSTIEKALHFKSEAEKEGRHVCEIKQLTITGPYEFPGNIFAAYIYDLLYDMYTLDGLYAKFEIASDAAGKRGLIDEFIIDIPGKKKVIINDPT
jgi:hypothetical protein